VKLALGTFPQHAVLWTQFSTAQRAGLSP